MAKYAADSLNIHTIIGKELTVIDTKIKEHRLFIKAVNRFDTSYFLGIDLSSKQLLFEVRDPIGNYIRSAFDVEGDSLYCIDRTEPAVLHIVSLRSYKKSTRKLLLSDVVAPGQILVNGRQMYLVSNVYGVAVVDLSTMKTTAFRNNNSSRTVSPLVSAVSLPLNKDMNLLSGDEVQGDRLKLYAIGKSGTVQWEFSIQERGNYYGISPLSADGLFLIKDDSSVVALDKLSGSIRWKSASYSHKKVIFCVADGYVVDFSLGNPLPNEEDIDRIIYPVKVRLLNVATGNVNWEYSFNAIDEPGVAMLAGKLLVSDKEIFRVVSLHEGRELEKTRFKHKEKHRYAFQIQQDLVTGENYLSSYDDVIYW
ncbi:PQQ-binding-like beta-propeller repeat protein [Paraflavitalea sp. CAU 1676]|uniref:outer membrane protein assembly factor BamB family protein n=1 Tax=Paraflavitalea sp. CAU 1676 TaxID=3032598 RepID=UPI0023DA2ABC|nr:PQQ-binding-like beta-propeller repeat protein [Paraflavitalea sp. CAU 1676]MDF2191687.1 PQQ-binding-like beta-propeller repeat protein [Paraflavitalea sp. CAU 1676]